MKRIFAVLAIFSIASALSIFSCTKDDPETITNVVGDKIPASMPTSVVQFDRYDENDVRLGTGYLDTKTGDRFSSKGDKIFEASMSSWFCYTQADFREAQEDYEDGDWINLIYDDVDYYWVEHSEGGYTHVGFMDNFVLQGNFSGRSTVILDCDSVECNTGWQYVDLANGWTTGPDSGYVANIDFTVQNTYPFKTAHNIRYGRVEYVNCSFPTLYGNECTPSLGAMKIGGYYFSADTTTGSRLWFDGCEGITVDGGHLEGLTLTRFSTADLTDCDPMCSDDACDLWTAYPYAGAVGEITVHTWIYDGDTFDNDATPTFSNYSVDSYDRNCDADVSFSISFSESNEDISDVYVESGCTSYTDTVSATFTSGKWRAKLDTSGCLGECSFIWRPFVVRCDGGEQEKTFVGSQDNPQIFCGICNK